MKRAKRKRIGLDDFLRRQAHIQKGRKLVALYKDGVINLVPKRPIAEMKGILKGMNIQSFREKKDRL